MTTNAPVKLRFDTTAGGPSIAEGQFTMKLATPSNGSIILEESQDFVVWLPIQTNTLSTPAGNAFYRLKLGN
jgi:hypothetical protein